MTFSKQDELVQFLSAGDAKINSLKVYFSPKQAGTGDPSPENVRGISGTNGVDVYHAGKNIGHIIGYSATTPQSPLHERILINKYGTTLNTTDPGNLTITQANYSDSTLSNFNNGYFVIVDDNLIFGEKYNLSFDFTIINNPLNATPIDILCYGPSGTVGGQTRTIVGNRLFVKNVPYNQHPTQPFRHGIDVRVCGMSLEISNVMITNANDVDCTYEPYYGELHKVNFPNLSKNVAHIVRYSAVASGSIFASPVLTNSYGTTLNTIDFYYPDTPLVVTQSNYDTSVNVYHYRNGYINIDCDNLEFEKRYNVSFKITDIVNNPLNASLSDLKFCNPYGNMYSPTSVVGDRVICSNYIHRQGISNPYRPTISIYNCGMSFTLSEFMVTEEDETDNTTYEPYGGIIYGGYVDLVSGELVEEWMYRDITTFSSIAAPSGSSEPWIHRFNLRNWSNATWDRAAGSSVLCDCIKSDNGIGKTNYTADDSTSNWYVYDDTISTVAEFKEKYTGHYCAYKLKNSMAITHQLTPSQLTTLTNQNTFWSNADRIEIEYDLIETRQIEMARRNIIMNSPHVESITGSNASFITDVASNLKECKIHFTPIQEGSGDPSPENVRPIHGWDGVTIFHNTQVPSEYQEVEYLEGTGTQYIITELVPKFLNNEEYFMRFAYTVNTKVQIFFGGNDKYTVFQGVALANGSPPSLKLRASDICSSYSGSAPFGKNEWIDFLITNNTLTCKEESGTIKDNVHNNEHNLVLFGKGGEASTLSAMKLAFVYYKRDGEYELNLIPCYRKSDNKPGMYDTVSGTFYTNSGTGEFAVGPDITGGEAYTISFPQTIYGGYVDLVKGEVVEEWAKWVEDGSRTPIYWTWTKDDANAVYTALMPALPVGSRHNPNFGFIEKVMCPNRHRVSITSPGVRTPNIISLYRAQNGASFAYSFTGEEFASMSKAELKAYIAENPIEAVYILLTPRTYPLDPVTIRTLRGMNNIFSSANGNVEISYWTH